MTDRATRQPTAAEVIEWLREQRRLSDITEPIDFFVRSAAERDRVNKILTDYYAKVRAARPKIVVDAG